MPCRANLRPKLIASAAVSSTSPTRRASRLRQSRSPLDLVIVATGILHEDGRMREKALRELDGAALTRTFQINTIGPALVLKHFVPLLAKHRRAVIAALSARVGSISDNRSAAGTAIGPRRPRST